MSANIIDRSSHHRHRTEYYAHSACGSTVSQWTGHTAGDSGYAECGGAVQPPCDGEGGGTGCCGAYTHWLERGKMRMRTQRLDTIDELGDSM
jgi:hypothetical protein